MFFVCLCVCQFCLSFFASRLRIVVELSVVSLLVGTDWVASNVVAANDVLEEAAEAGRRGGVVYV